MKKIVFAAAFFLTILLILPSCAFSENFTGVKDEYTLDLSDLTGAVLSVNPDGEMIVCMDQEKIYFYDRDGDEIEDIKIDKDLILRSVSRRGSANEKCTWSKDGRYLLIDCSVEVLSYRLNANIALLDTQEYEFVEVSDNDIDIKGISDELSPCYAACFSADGGSIFYLQRDFGKEELYLMQYDIKKDTSEEIYEFDDDLDLLALANIDDNYFVGLNYGRGYSIVGIDVENDDEDELIDEDFDIELSDKSVELMIDNFFFAYFSYAYTTDNGVVFNFLPSDFRKDELVVAQYYNINYTKGDWEVEMLVENDKKDRIVAYIPSDSGKYALLTFAKYEKTDDNTYKQKRDADKEVVLCEIKNGEFIEIESLGKGGNIMFGMEEQMSFVGTGIAINGNCAYLINTDDGDKELHVYILE